MHLDFKKNVFVVLVAATVTASAFGVLRSTIPSIVAAALLDQAPNARNGLQAFAAMDPVDTHVHAFKSDPDFTNLIARLHLHLLDICVADRHLIYGDLTTELARAYGFVHGSQGHAKTLRDI